MGPGFVRVMEDLESHKILEFRFAGLKSQQQQSTVMEFKCGGTWKVVDKSYWVYKINKAGYFLRGKG